MALDHIPLELKFSEDEPGTLTGIGSVYNNVDQGQDIVLPGAFTESLKSRKPKMLFQHDPSRVLGVWTDWEDTEKSLNLKGQIFTDTTLGADTYKLVQAKAIDGLSIGYRTIADSVETRDGKRVRVIEKAELWEVSVVTFPMNPAAVVTGVKHLETPQDVESILRAAGVPNKFAKLVAMHGYDGAKSRLNGGRSTPEGDAELSALHQSLRKLKETING